MEWGDVDKYDFIHSRYNAVSFRKPRYVMKSVFKALRAGGVFEMQDLVYPLRCDDGSLDNTWLKRWQELLLVGANNLGLNWRKTVMYQEWMEDEGFEKVKCKSYQWPINKWPKDSVFKELGLMFK